MEKRTSNSKIETIMKEIANEHLKTTKRFRESWMKRQSQFRASLFRYADDDFYFYRFAVQCLERTTTFFLSEILQRLLLEYNYSILSSNETRETPFAFIVKDENVRKGYCFDDFNYDGINSIIELFHIEMVYIIRPWAHGDLDKKMDRSNKQYDASRIKIKEIFLEDFFNEFFCKQDYQVFLNVLQQYIADAREIIGFQSIRFLSAMNLSMQKLFAEKQLMEWPYEISHYQIINPNNPKIQNYLYVSRYSFDPIILQEIIKNYISCKLYRALVGKEEFAQSFITSEWLYFSLKGAKNFDYTSVVSGYLKSIEQLLLKIVELNIDNDCVISMNSKYASEAKASKAVFYSIDNSTHQKTCIEKPIKYTYIDYTTAQKNYADSSIGTFEFFIRNNPKIFIDNSLAKTISDMVSCFRAECRNGYFHTHNLESWEIVEKTRKNAIYLYFLLLGSCTMSLTKKNELGLLESDYFDTLCKAIREFRHYSTNFIFEYDNGQQKKLIYDFKNNTIEFTDDGIEHYESLFFYEVEDFSISSYEKIDLGEKEKWKVYLTRNSLPKKIWGIDINNQLCEIKV